MDQNLSLGMAVVGVIISAGGIYIWKKPSSDTPVCEQQPPQKNQTKGEKAPSPGILERITLSSASDNWTDRNKIIHLSEASKLWVTVEEDKPDTTPRPYFKHDAIDTFYKDYIETRTYVHGTRKTVLIELLKLLDESGTCPSVVRNLKDKSEIENGYKDDVFSLLAQIPLWEHSLSVARHMVQRTGRETLIPDAMIASLAHDIGKIPAYHDKGYATGDHPIISAHVLTSFGSFANLTSADEICLIVREHHSLNPRNVMGALLKTCDQLVRNQEIASKLNYAGVEEQTSPSCDMVNATIIKHADCPQPDADPAMQRAHPLTPTAPAHKNHRVDIQWLSLQAVLAELLPWVNRYIKDNWGAVSMSDGQVYVNSNCLWGVLKKVAPGNPVLLAADANESEKRNILYSVVWELSEKHNAIAVEMLGPDYYMVPVTIINGAGKRLPKHFLIPFKSHEAFGVLPSELEKLKTADLWRAVKSIKPEANNY